ncbi:response regulator [candidate division WOR-3 bacterium]|nr:response regulator [candidate division WOR-3 bacterium]
MAEKRTILLVDDDIFLVDIMAFTFKQSGFEIIKAHNGKEALEVIDKESIDLILTDIMMPVMDGFELAKNIKENPKIRHLPIIFLTAKSNIEDKNKGFSLGINDYVVKPFNLKDLVSRINKVLDENTQ